MTYQNKNQASDVFQNGQTDMTEDKVRKIFMEELIKNAYSGSPVVPRHVHDNVSSPQVNEKYILPGIRFNGTIEMTQNTIYTIPISGTPKDVTFYGGALGGGAHAMVVGNAKLGGTNLQFQPGTSTSVTLNNVVAGIIQGSAAIVLSGYICNSQGYICNVLDSSITNNLATADVISYSNTEIKIKVTLVAPYTKITGLWIVT